MSDISELYDDFGSWINVAPGDEVEIIVNGESALKSVVYSEGTMGVLKKRSTENIKKEGTYRFLMEAYKKLGHKKFIQVFSENDT